MFVAAAECQAEALQREVCARNTYWLQQRQREEDILSDLDAALFQCLFKVTSQVSGGVGVAVLMLSLFTA